MEKPLITNIQAGLSEKHREQKPLVDRIELQRGCTKGTRTYEDGTQYLILSDPRAPDFNEADVVWREFVQITVVGIERMKQIIRESMLSYQGAPPVASPGGGAGTITWIVYVDGQEKVLKTASGSYERLPAFVRQIDEAGSQNVQR